MRAFSISTLLLIGYFASSAAQGQSPGGGLVQEPYLLETGLESRSISFENPTGGRGIGGQAASRLGPGRKGAAWKAFQPRESVELCNIEDRGTIRHIWLTLSDRSPAAFRSMTVRAWWDDQPHPSIECPLGEFFGFMHGKVNSYQSAAHSVGEMAGLNFWLPMPFDKRARITLTNESDKPIRVFYQIDYTIGDKHPEDVGRMHVLFRRENPTTEQQDFEILPERKGKGRYMGAVLGIRNLHPGVWWGEGEVKMFMDGDKEFATIVGTGSEDYVGVSFGMQQTPFLYHGCSLNQNDFVSMYRWHLPDPIYWKESCRITIQQIAMRRGLAETSDDWATATFWYEGVPSEPLPAYPPLDERVKDLWTEPAPATP